MKKEKPEHRHTTIFLPMAIAFPAFLLWFAHGLSSGRSPDVAAHIWMLSGLMAVAVCALAIYLHIQWRDEL